MLNRIPVFMRAHWNPLIGSLGAALVVTTLVLVPIVRQSISGGLVLIPLFGFVLFAVPYVLSTIVTTLFSLVIVLGLYLLRIRHSPFVTAVGFTLAYVFISGLSVVMRTSLPLMFILSIIVALVVFYGIIQLVRKVRIRPVVSFFVFVVLMSLCTFSAQYLDSLIAHSGANAKHNAYQNAQNRDFETVKSRLGFTVYYPTYSSTLLPVSPPKLNGYSQQLKQYTHPNVTYTLGRAHVLQSGQLKNQDKIMDFSRNCDIMRLSYAMPSSAEVSQSVINNSLENLSRCTVVHTRPTGEKVYYRKNGQWTTFYVQISTTNIVIEFDDINTEKYNVKLLPEVTKIIDSLRPISLDKVQRGSDMISDYR